MGFRLTGGRHRGLRANTMRGALILAGCSLLLAGCSLRGLGRFATTMRGGLVVILNTDWD
jgi:hypothetical protein